MNSKKIKILHCIRQGQIGGGETYLIDLAKSLDSRQFESVILSFTDGAMVETLRSLGIKTYVVHTESGFDFKIWDKVSEIIELEDVDIVHAHGTRANSNTFWAAKKAKKPFIYTVHGWSFHQDQSKVILKIRETIEKFLISETDLTILVSFSNQRDGVERLNLKKSKVIHSGIDLEKFDIHKNYDDLRTQWNIPKDKLIVGFLVRMTIQKDPHTMLYAIRKVLDKTKDIYFVFIGDGDLKESSVELAKELNIESNVIFDDFRLDIPNVLNSIDIYCLPSLWEGLPLGLLEAMAMKRAVIATPVDGTKEVIVDKESGLLVPIKDSEALSKAILMLHDNPKLREQMVDNAYQLVHKYFDMKRMAKEVGEVYNRVIIKNKINPFIKFKLDFKNLVPFKLGKKLRGFYQKLLRIIYYGNKFYCPYCKLNFSAFLSTGIDIPIYDELDVVGAGKRKNCTCPRCYSTDRDRLLYFYLDKYKLEENSKVLHIMPESAVKALLSSNDNISYSTGRNFKDRYFFNKDFFQLDVTSLYYDSNSFDMVIANHILHNIKNDNQALDEIYRVLKPGGRAIIQVPISYKIENSIEDDYLILPKIKEKHFFKYEKVRLYGTDFFSKVKERGFDLQLIDPLEENWETIIKSSALNPKEKLIVAIKN